MSKEQSPLHVATPSTPIRFEGAVTREIDGKRLSDTEIAAVASLGSQYLDALKGARRGSESAKEQVLALGDELARGKQTVVLSFAVGLHNITPEQRQQSHAEKRIA